MGQLDQSTSVAQGVAALCLPFQKWQKSMIQILWTVRWTVTGLTPVRPLVVTLTDMNIPAESALLLS